MQASVKHCRSLNCFHGGQAKAELKFSSVILLQFCFKPIKTTGSAGEIICAVAAEENPAMIVLGSRGQGLISRTLLGSVSDYCVHHSSVPVVVVPPSDRHEKHGTDNYGGHDAVCQKTKEQ